MPKAGSEMSRVLFMFQYTGEAVDAGTMDVRTLAPALLALGDICEQANDEINGREAKASVNINAFAPGSFIIEFGLAVSLLGAAAKLLRIDNIKSASEVLDVVKNVVEIVKALKGKKVQSVTEIGNGMTRLTVEHNHTHDVSDRVFNLIKKRSIQHDVKHIVSPLRSDGIDALNILAKSGELLESVTSDDLSSFEAMPYMLPADEQVAIENTSTIEKWFKVITISSDTRIHWKLSDGSNTYSVKVDDKTLIRDAAEGHLGIEPGFLVNAKIMSETRLVNNEPKTENHLVAVLEVRMPDNRDKTQRMI